MNDLFKKDYARKLNCEAQDPTKILWCLFHHPVLNPHKPEKVRVNFNFSAKYDNISLNDQLLQEPDMTSSLVSVLTRVKEKRVVMRLDIKSMFYQVRVKPSNCSALQFPCMVAKWKARWTSPRVRNASASFWWNIIANFSALALKRAAKYNKTELELQTMETVKHNFCVDDWNPMRKQEKGQKNSQVAIKRWFQFNQVELDVTSASIGLVRVRKGQKKSSQLLRAVHPKSSGSPVILLNLGSAWSSRSAPRLEVEYCLW